MNKQTIHEKIYKQWHFAICMSVFNAEKHRHIIWLLEQELARANT